MSSIKTLEIPEFSGDRLDCTKSKIDHNVTLAFGHHAGSFLKANKSIKNMKRCVQQCCQMKKCDVALFSNKACYSVQCASMESCAPRINNDKRMDISISYVAKHKSKQKIHDNEKSTKGGEPAVDDNLLAEVTQESPFDFDEGLVTSSELLKDDNSDKELKRSRRESWRETKDMFVAIACGFVAVAVGVIGVITMTRQLVEDDDDIEFDSKNSYYSSEKVVDKKSNETGDKPTDKLLQSDIESSEKTKPSN